MVVERNRMVRRRTSHVLCSKAWSERPKLSSTSFCLRKRAGKAKRGRLELLRPASGADQAVQIRKLAESGSEQTKQNQPPRLGGLALLLGQAVSRTVCDVVSEHLVPSLTFDPDELPSMSPRGSSRSPGHIEYVTATIKAKGLLETTQALPSDMAGSQSGSTRPPRALSSASYAIDEPLASPAQPEWPSFAASNTVDEPPPGISWPPRAPFSASYTIDEPLTEPAQPEGPSFAASNTV